ncbi:MAG: enoyl-CoA hydratase/isomerase family protein, partial [Actinobacteria bacterium]
AKEMCITGGHVKADEALRIGLADEVVPSDELHTRAIGLAAEVAKGALVAQSICKRLIDEGMSTSLVDGLALERDGFIEVFATDDASIGVASFLENGPGKAEFTGR